MSVPFSYNDNAGSPQVSGAGGSGICILTFGYPLS